MKEDRILNVFGQVNEEYIEEAAPERQKDERRKKTNRARISWTAAVCLCVTAAAVIIGFTLKNGNVSKIVASEKEFAEVNELSSSLAVPENNDKTAATVIQMSSITFNETENIDEMLAAFAYFESFSPGIAAQNSSRSESITEIDELKIRKMSEDEIREYLGRSIQPDYLPSNLIGDAHSVRRVCYGNAFMFSDESVEIPEDSPEYALFISILEQLDAAKNGGTGENETDVSDEQGVSVTASKTGGLSEMIVNPKENEITSVIGDTEVLFRCYEISGKSGSEQNNPSSDREITEALFSIDGTEYLIQTWGIDRNEAVKTVASFILETDNIEIAR